MKRKLTKEENDSYIHNDIAELFLDNNRKLVISETNHYNSVYISIRTFLKTQDISGKGWIPSRKGLFFKKDIGRVIWPDLDKIIRNMLDLNEPLSVETTPYIDDKTYVSPVI